MLIALVLEFANSIQHAVSAKTSERVWMTRVECEKTGMRLLEGHVRLTTYFLAPHCIPDAMQVIVGFSPAFE